VTRWERDDSHEPEARYSFGRRAPCDYCGTETFTLDAHGPICARCIHQGLTRAPEKPQDRSERRGGTRRPTSPFSSLWGLFE
jgi:hypothetical protein